MVLWLRFSFFARRSLFRDMPLDTFMAETMSCLGSGIQDGGCMGGGSGRGRMGHGLMVVMAE